MISTPLRLAVIGGGAAGLMAAETARATGVGVDVYEAKGSVGRKFLLAGKGGLNLTHSDEFDTLVARYGARARIVRSWLSAFGADELRHWARELGVETFVGSSGRVFPRDLKAAPLLRAWVRRLREQGVTFHMNHRCLALTGTTVRLRTPQGEREVRADAVVLGLGGGSWPALGSDGEWVDWLRAAGAQVAPLQPANCGFDIGWSEVFAQRYAGQPLKSIKVTAPDPQGPDLQRRERVLQGECVVTATGLEGSVIYELSAGLREAIHADGSVTIHLDLAPDRDLQRLQQELSRPRQGRSITEHLRRTVSLEGVKTGLLYEVMPKAEMNDVNRLAMTVKSLPLRLIRPRPLAEAISSAGGVMFEALDDALMIRSLSGVFCAGEMLDWEAPTGGYLLTACFASGRIAGRGAGDWLMRR